ncbi:hypothetical protein [Sphingobacterium sp. LRF_L2]|uniref:hypothetical protein n=1 Tax=Sphingobacterium sp. LRF_L2 TaxID=3369421 RepID=UPI003F5E803F
MYRKKLFFIGLIIAGLLIYLFFFREDKGIYENDNTAIPQQYQRYQSITAAYASETFKVDEVCRAKVNSSASSNPIRAYQSVQDQIIIDCNSEIDEDSKSDATYFKINKLGIITDSLHVKYGGYWTVLIDDFMLHTQEKLAYFTTWPMNGNTEHQPFIAYNTDFQMPEKELQIELARIKEESLYYFVRSYVGDHLYTVATYYYDAKGWQILWQKVARYQSESDSESASRYQQEIYRSGEPEPYMDAKVHIEYFHPQDRLKYFHVIGGGTPGFSKVDWRGIGFFRTEIDGEPFLFSISDLVIEKESHDRFRTRLYQVDEPKAAVKHINTNFYHSPFGFALYAPNAKILYVIKKN